MPAQTKALPIGVLWGYGTKEELADAVARYSVETPEGLVEKIAAGVC